MELGGLFGCSNITALLFFLLIWTRKFERSDILNYWQTTLSFDCLLILRGGENEIPQKSPN